MTKTYYFPADPPSVPAPCAAQQRVEDFEKMIEQIRPYLKQPPCRAPPSPPYQATPQGNEYSSGHFW